MNDLDAPLDMSDPESTERQLKLEFETPQFLHSLFANNPHELRYMERHLGIRAVTRDGWLLLSGPAEAVELGRKMFAELEEARRCGARITDRDFRLAVDLILRGADVGVGGLAGLRLLGARGRTPVGTLVTW